MYTSTIHINGRNIQYQDGQAELPKVSPSSSERASTLSASASAPRHYSLELVKLWAVLGFVDKNRENQYCIQGLEWSYFNTTVNEVLVHMKELTIYVQFIWYLGEKNLRTVNYCTCSTKSFDVFLSRLVLCRKHLSTDVWRGMWGWSPEINPNAQTFMFHFRVKKRKKDKSIFITRLWWCSPQAAWSVSILLALSRMCFKKNILHICTLESEKCSHF